LWAVFPFFFMGFGCSVSLRRIMGRGHKWSSTPIGILP
jgi:hypothetical protein